MKLVNTPKRGAGCHGWLAQQCRVRPRRGFTLVELLLVMSMIVVLLGMSYPTLRRSLGSYRLREAAKTMRVQVARARLAAIESGVPQELRFVPGEAVFRLAPARGFEPEVADSGSAGDPEAGPRLTTAGDPRQCGAGATSDFQAAPRELAEEQNLPDSVIFAHEQPSKVDATGAQLDPAMTAGDSLGDPALAATTGDDRNWSAPIVFRPDGTTVDTQFVIANDRQQCIVLSLRGLTGALDQSDLQSLEEMQATAEAAVAPADRMAGLPTDER